LIDSDLFWQVADCEKQDALAFCCDAAADPVVRQPRDKPKRQDAAGTRLPHSG
jgi:hypothetical protein